MFFWMLSHIGQRGSTAIFDDLLGSIFRIPADLLEHPTLGRRFFSPPGLHYLRITLSNVFEISFSPTPICFLISGALFFFGGILYWATDATRRSPFGNCSIRFALLAGYPIPNSLSLFRFLWCRILEAFVYLNVIHEVGLLN